MAAPAKSKAIDRHALDLNSYEEFDDEFAFWPLNLVLLILGASVIGVAFTYLDARDTRLPYNPWSYVVVTPILLMAVSVLLRTLVSKVIQKSMQMAFLLSVLLHLFLLVGAMNVVIFSQLWPDLLDSLAKERHEMKRQSLQAPQFHQMVATNDQSRPDYLRPVETEHDATEVDLAEKLSINLAKSAAQNLVTPVPKLDRAANPHLIEQARVSPATPTSMDSAANLSRSELQRELQSREPVPYELPQQERQPELTAQQTAESRSATSSNLLSPPTSSPQLTQSNPNTASLSRNENGSNLPEPSQSSVTLQRSASPASRMMDLSQIEMPRLSDPSSSTEQIDSSDRAAVASRSQTMRSSLDAGSLPAAPSSDVSTPTSSRIQRRQPEFRTPQASAGEFASALRRSTAGGRASPPAPSSLPVQGVEALAGDQVAPAAELRAAQLSNRRQGVSGRAASKSTTLGMPQAPTWNGTPGVSGGISGTSPSQLAADSADGAAASADVADLAGTGRELQRSRTGLPGLPGSLSGPSVPDQAGRVERGRDQSGAANNAVAAASAEAVRARQTGGASLSGPRLLQGESTGGEASGYASKLNSQLNEMRRQDSGNIGTGSQQVAGAVARQFERSQSGSRPPTSQGAAVPALAGDLSSTANAEGDSARNALDDAGAASPQRRSSSAANLLAINEPPGSGGVAPLTPRSGSLIPRRNDLARRDEQSDLQTQRFSRSAVGGPLSAGQIAIPKPAFQQRIERLRDGEGSATASAEPQTELAIERGLAFLAKHQRADGSWRLQDFDTEVLMTSDTAATGLALLAFQGAGYTHQDFKYSEVCKRAIQFLRERQTEEGDLYIPQNPASDQNAWLYSHGIASIALCEAYGMTQDPELKEPAQRAVDFIIQSQDKRRGGWRYRPGVGSDTSVSGWFMMALMSARLAGLDADEQTFDRLRRFLDLSQDSQANPHLYRYNPYAADNARQGHGLKPTAVMTSVGLLMRLYTGWERSDEPLRAGARYLLQNLPEQGTLQESKRDTYYWYYATQVMFHMGGEAWREWHNSLYPMLIENQVVDGEFEGSWDPLTPTPDLWARYGGRLYVTTMNLLSLEVTYRHLPLYDVASEDE